MNNINVVYLGNNFYFESGTIMSELMLEDGARYDYGKLRMALRDGNTIIIRQATDKELVKAYRKLQHIKDRIK